MYLALGGLAHEALAVVGKRDNGRGGTSTLSVLNHTGSPTLIWKYIKRSFSINPVPSKSKDVRTIYIYIHTYSYTSMTATQELVVPRSIPITGPLASRTAPVEVKARAAVLSTEGYKERCRIYIYTNIYFTNRWKIPSKWR